MSPRTDRFHLRGQPAGLGNLSLVIAESFGLGTKPRAALFAIRGKDRLPDDLGLAASRLHESVECLVDRIVGTDSNRRHSVERRSERM